MSMLSFAIIGLLWMASNAYSMELSDEFWQQAANCLSPGMFPAKNIYTEHGLRFCGTPYLLPLANRETIVPDFMIPLGDRPIRTSFYNSPAGHFKIHYDASGQNAPLNLGDTNPADGVPDYINIVGDICDYVWSIEIDSLGFPSPPPDTASAFDGDPFYDIYITNLTVGLFGQTVPDDAFEYPKWTSFIEIDNDYSWYPPGYLPALQVTLAHEFFHSIQMGIDATEYPDSPYSPWWFEASSVWMEEQAYDNVNDYLNYLPTFFGDPAMSLTASGPHVYSACVWPIFLSERFERNIMWRIWIRCGEVNGYNVIHAFDEILTYPDYNYNSNLNRAFAEFTVWNYFTGTRAANQPAGTTYQEAATYSMIPNDMIAKISSYPDTVTVGNEVPYAPQYLAANYIEFEVLTDSIGGVWAGFDGHNNATWEVALFGASPEDSPKTVFFDLDNENRGADTLRNWYKYTHVIMAPSAVGSHYFLFDATYSYSYIVDYDSSLVGDEPIHDVGVWAILTPSGAVSLDSIISPGAIIRNDGIGQETFPVVFKIGASYCDSSIVTIGAQRSDTVNFRSWAANQIGTFVTSCYSTLVGDQNTANDTLEGIITFTPGMGPEIHGIAVSPSPFVPSKGHTQLSFFGTKLPHAEVRIYSRAGEYVKTLKETLGSDRLDWDGKNDDGKLLASGVYVWIATDQNGKQLDGKFAIIR